MYVPAGNTGLTIRFRVWNAAHTAQPINGAATYYDAVSPGSAGIMTTTFPTSVAVTSSQLYQEWIISAWDTSGSKYVGYMNQPDTTFWSLYGQIGDGVYMINHNRFGDTGDVFPGSAWGDWTYSATIEFLLQ